MNKLSAILIFSAFTLFANAQKNANFAIYNNKTTTLFCNADENEVVHTAIDLFKNDVKAVLGNTPKEDKAGNADIIIGTLDNNYWKKWTAKNHISTDSLALHNEGYILKVIHVAKKPQLLVLGHDKRGTAYGILSLSRMLGVSPWYWWADCKPAERTDFVLGENYEVLDYPKIMYRGIFINDEDWGLEPWASKNYEPKMRALNGGSSEVVEGEIGPYTHERIFELLLRLKANTFWPAMHSCSKPFYLVKGNREMAKKYGMIISTSHCEPMMRNTNGEWKQYGKGEYDYIHNADNVINFWQERVNEVKDDDCIYTLGMRGVHDSGMLGAKTLEERTSTLQDIIGVQRKMLSNTIGMKAESIPQQFIPYKEVLECYDKGMDIPDDVTLMWCDDNYGYIRHFPTAKERARKGGNGVYYHVSYWGRPHDYLWLATTHPELMQSEMNRAYNSGIRTSWILNVGDIKPAEYLTSLFLDMAWDIKKVNDMGINRHRANWYNEQVGVNDRRLSAIWDMYYDLNFNYKPEFLGGTRTEEKDPSWKVVKDINLNEIDIKNRLAKVDHMLHTLDVVEATNSSTKSPAWMELVSYPVLAVATMNQKMLGAQLARHKLQNWDMAEDAQSGIIAMCRRYNTFIDGKWNGMIDYKPRELAVFQPVKRDTVNTAMPEGETGNVLFESYDSPIGFSVKNGASLSVEIDVEEGKPIDLEVRVLPIHSSSSSAELVYKVKLDNEEKVADIHTVGRDENWKQNVLRNYASNRFVFFPKRTGKVYLSIAPEFDGFRIQKIIEHQ